MVKGFVFGKFLPFHKGHAAMIAFALQHCDALTVLVCSSDRETIPGAVRQQWIAETFTGRPELTVRVFEYDEAVLPNSSAASKEISKVWAGVFSDLLPDHTVLVTSEPYGDYVAGYMGIRHIIFDRERVNVPVSATGIRADLPAHWSFLPDSVRPFFVYKVVILGTESTGKTTLTRDLSRHFGCSMVPEAGRDLINNSNVFNIEDLYRVASAHASNIRRAVQGNSYLVIIDTDIHTTQAYCRYAFGKELAVSDDIYADNRADLYLYLNNDVPHEQDGTRLSEEDRNVLEQFHRQVLADHSMEVVEISGGWSARFAGAVAAIQLLMRERRLGRAVGTE